MFYETKRTVNCELSGVLLLKLIRQLIIFIITPTERMYKALKCSHHALLTCLKYIFLLQGILRYHILSGPLKYHIWSIY